MAFNSHFNLVGLHASLSPSKYSWIRYDEDKMARVFLAQEEAARGVALHEFAAMAIKLGKKLPANGTTLSRYVNDCIGWRMTPEQVLFYSEHCFGTADACSFRRNVFKVSDLKNGVTPASMDQTKIYCGLFCLEYRQKPFEITMEMRIYQNDDCRFEIADPDEITHIMDKIKTFDRMKKEMRMEAMS